MAHNRQVCPICEEPLGILQSTCGVCKSCFESLSPQGQSKLKLSYTLLMGLTILAVVSLFVTVIFGASLPNPTLAVALPLSLFFFAIAMSIINVIVTKRIFNNDNF